MKESNDISVNVRTLVEFLLRNGDITAGDSFMSPERAQKGSEIHREIQKGQKKNTVIMSRKKHFRQDLKEAAFCSR